ncbi:helix-turn-helix domain-containing protein [Pseudorhodoferax sp. Leaf265]|uniref:helix-turn-helix domain-containing protein n=1 Tax=Pseudorhodoferax sp. Leaf265 TaxID=1736315 RepID=UPI0009E67048|nr:helix-turn-helix transcriptional regulator [Pseudorhodoferax sp. Leaf265]
MANRLAPGRRLGSTTFDPVIAAAFGDAVLAIRTSVGLSQLALATESGIERAHVGRLERGERVPNFVAVVKIAKGLGCSTARLVEEFDTQLAAAADAKQR